MTTTNFTFARNQPPLLAALGNALSKNIASATISAHDMDNRSDRIASIRSINESENNRDSVTMTPDEQSSCKKQESNLVKPS